MASSHSPTGGAAGNAKIYQSLPLIGGRERCLIAAIRSQQRWHAGTVAKCLLRISERSFLYHFGKYTTLRCLLSFREHKPVDCGREAGSNKRKESPKKLQNRTIGLTDVTREIDMSLSGPVRMVRQFLSYLKTRRAALLSTSRLAWLSSLSCLKNGEAQGHTARTTTLTENYRATRRLIKHMIGRPP